MPRLNYRWYATNRAKDFEHESDRAVRMKQIYETIDRQPYQWIVVIVAGVGFFLDGYTLFASNIVLPMIAYVYWPTEVSTNRLALINVATLSATAIGQVLFGFLADKIGRKKVYGAELMVVIAATLGITMSSTGAHDSMDIYAWLIWWRIFVGIGVGADYPLSAVITSEFAPKKHRAQMMASVFFMQPLGQVLCNLLSLAIITGVREQHIDDPVKAVDMIWRWVIGVGVCPGVIALLFRLAIPETPRFLLEIEEDPVQSVFDAEYIFGAGASDSINLSDRADSSIPSSNAAELYEDNKSHKSPTLSTRSIRFSGPSGSPTITTATSGRDSRASLWPETAPNMPTLNSGWKISRDDIIRYFWTDGNWRSLSATSACWFLLDFGFYGIALSNPQFLAKTWGHGALNINATTPAWKTTEDPSVTIFDMLFQTSVRALVILNIGSFAGGVLLIFLINHIRRKYLQAGGFMVLTAIFIALGCLLMTDHANGTAALILYVLGQLFFNLGPNGTTYIFPGELFPTRYRATCYGIAAAAGKLGSICVQLFSTYYKIGASSPNIAMQRKYGETLIVFSALMVFGAILTLLWVPDVQKQDLSNKSLEELAAGRKNWTRRESTILRLRRTFGARESA